MHFVASLADRLFGPAVFYVVTLVAMYAPIRKEA